ncbi:MAG: pyridoxal 5'-phosphate synthase glutaminase subunit PdxT [Acidobacteriaceae bacterium]|nr:pyridoxal 5'-phosphate synthase glutaminase subunit PdxT [Acidobacteriaceae bacterium]
MVEGAGVGPKIGVLALQGDFDAHRRAIERAGGEAVEVRTAAELEAVAGLILPGGESTTMLKLLHEEKLFEPLKEFGARKPIFGTCAGAILLAKEVLNPRQESLGLMDATVERNGYGRQIDSRIVDIDLEGEPSEAVFIRAPIIRQVGPEAKVLGKYMEDPVLIEEGRHLAATFHPELGRDVRIHRRFVEKVKRAA